MLRIIHGAGGRNLKFSTRVGNRGWLACSTARNFNNVVSRGESVETVVAQFDRLGEGVNEGRNGRK